MNNGKISKIMVIYIMQNFEIRLGQNINPFQLARELEEFGYTKTSEISYGSYIQKGDRLTIWPILSTVPCVIDFFGNTVENISQKIEKKRVKIPKNNFSIAGAEIFPGDLVVHIDHGVGEFLYLLNKEVESKARLYIELRYADDGHLFVPYDRLDLIYPYAGISRKIAKLTKLGSGRWVQLKKRVLDSIFKLAKELLLTHAKRELAKGEALNWPEEWEEKLSCSFPYKLTIDQKKTLDDVLMDLKSARPMDRLISGDVGFGKTEVAIRAAALAVGANKQVAVMAPTTILVEQHVATFENRLQDLPIKIGRLSRFASKEEIEEVIKNINNGVIDVVIGTHKLLSNKINFPKFGLLIIDEEQKFGVKHKEKLKQLRADVNILTLSATPIPRTLFMGLSGLRDMSVIATPPAGRMAIETEVKQFDEKFIKEAVIREVNRGGQAYYLFNDIERMPVRLRQLQKLLPGISIDIVNGQMEEKKLGKVMHSFTKGEIDVLLCSTIIESGIDLPNVNTLVVERAERFGLADIYQLRGRVGRSNRQAYALLMYTPYTLVGPARERLLALKDMVELGKGYEIAVRDLEIRGGGNVLGKEQSGNMEAIGLALYSKLLKQVVERLKEKI